MTERPTPPSNEDTGQQAATDQERRKFLVAGLVAAPLLVTLSARPAWARQDGSLGNYASSTGGTSTDTTEKTNNGRNGGRGGGS